MSNHLTREEYLALVYAFLEEEFNDLDLNRPGTLNLPSNTFANQALANTNVIDSEFFLESDDDWGRPIPFGWIGEDAHFTGEYEQDYNTDKIIEVIYD
jgi:hypothetical protein